MVERGNVDKHRRTYSSGVKAVEEQKWGRSTGAPNPEDRHAPQHPENQHGPKYVNRTPDDWRRGFGKNGVESGEGKPNFHPGHHGGNEKK
jgi:hypothetical protein